MSRACGEPGHLGVQQQDVMSSTILLVDDEQDIVETLRYSLEREGYNTLSARSGAAAMIMAMQRRERIMARFLRVLGRRLCSERLRIKHRGHREHRGLQGFRKN